MKILIFSAYYLPGYKGGGPIRTISNMVEALAEKIDFYVFTLDRDLGDLRAYPNVESDKWIILNNYYVYYVNPRNFLSKLVRVLKKFDGDALHLNSFFSYQFSILPLLVNKYKANNIPVIIGPRGEFSEGALALKSTKKKFYLYCAKILNLYKDVVWHASTVFEAADIRRIFGSNANIRIAIDLTSSHSVIKIPPKYSDSTLRIVFLSRISPKKNLLGAIKILKLVKCPVEFYIYGPIEDQSYWNSCCKATKELPNYVKVHYEGSLMQEYVPQKLTEYDLFFLPTFGENFGHVFAEALYSGLPILTSTYTPWRDLETLGLGKDIPLAEIEKFVEYIEYCSGINKDCFMKWRLEIQNWAVKNINSEKSINENKDIYNHLKVIK